MAMHRLDAQVEDKPGAASRTMKAQDRLTASSSRPGRAAARNHDRSWLPMMKALSAHFDFSWAVAPEQG
jgi:hypothetical protein